MSRHLGVPVIMEFRPTPKVVGSLFVIAVVTGVAAWIAVTRYPHLIGIGRTGRAPTPSPVASAPTPTPIPLALGKQVYAMRTEAKTPGPSVSEATFDPLDVPTGETITVSVKAKDPRGVASVTVTVLDDAGAFPHELTRSGGSATDGVWVGSWTADSTHLTRYGATIDALNTAGEKRTIELWFR